MYSTGCNIRAYWLAGQNEALGWDGVKGCWYSIASRAFLSLSFLSIAGVLLFL